MQRLTLLRACALLQLAALQLRAQFEPPERWLGNNASRGDEAGCEVLVARSWEVRPDSRVSGFSGNSLCDSLSQELQHFLFLDSWDDRIGKHRLRCAPASVPVPRACRAHLSAGTCSVA